MYPIQQRLRTLAQDSPGLKDAAWVYEAILPLLWDADLHVVPVSITPDEARTKMERGVPLLHDLDLELDGQAAHELMLSLARAVETLGEENQPRRRWLLPLPPHAGRPGATPYTDRYADRYRDKEVPLRTMAAREIRLALEEDKFDAGALLSAVAAGDSRMVTATAQYLQLDPGLVWTRAQNAFKPALHAWRRQLAPGVAEIPWRQGYCFICGAAAALGELQENDQAKHLRCGQCGADWPFPRLQCLYCGNEDHNTLRYLYSENEREKMRVEVCDKCRGYLKVIAAFTPTPPEMLTVEDLATLHLDYIAQARGYIRGAAQFKPGEDSASAPEEDK